MKKIMELNHEIQDVIAMAMNEHMKKIHERKST
jgi:hypothetical protein